MAVAGCTRSETPTENETTHSLRVVEESCESDIAEVVVSNDENYRVKAELEIEVYDHNDELLDRRQKTEYVNSHRNWVAEVEFDEYNQNLSCEAEVRIAD